MVALPFKRSKVGSFPDELNDFDQPEQICQKIMEKFEERTQIIPNPHSLPTTRFQETSILDYLPTSTTFEVHLMWSLAQALLDNTLREWLSRLIEPNLQDTLARIKNQTDDPWAEVFTYLCYGQLEKASEKTKSIKAFQMSLMIDLSAIKSMHSVISSQIAGLKDRDIWDGLTVYEQKVWYLLSGRLGWVPEGYVVTEDQTWQRTLSMYVFYAQAVDEPDKLSVYTDMINPHKKKRLYSPDLAFQEIASPDKQCLWYQLLEWWYGGEGEHLKEWPLELTWLLSFYRPDRFKDDQIALAWIDRLQKSDLPEYAIYASLFIKHDSVDKHLKQLLQSYEWEKEDMLLHNFHIPKERILIGKALYAHEEWDFEAEYKYFLEASYEKEAKATLFNFLLPKLYKVNDQSSLESSLSYITEYSNQDDEDIKIFKDLYTMLVTKEGDKEELLFAFDRVDKSSNRSFNFFNLMSKLTDAFKDI